MLTLRTPTGADQQQYATLSDEQALQQLLRRCITSVNAEPPSDEFIQDLVQSDIEAIDELLADQAAGEAFTAAWLEHKGISWAADLILQTSNGGVPCAAE